MKTVNAWDLVISHLPGEVVYCFDSDERTYYCRMVLNKDNEIFKYWTYTFNPEYTLYIYDDSICLQYTIKNIIVILNAASNAILMSHL